MTETARQPDELDDPVDEQEIPALVRCDDQRVLHRAIMLAGVMPSGLCELLVLAVAIHSDVHFSVQRKEWSPGEWANRRLLHEADEDAMVKLYDARKKAAVETFMEREEREYDRLREYGANEDNRLYGDKLAAVRDQHCRIRQLKEQHSRSMQANYTNSLRGGKENKQRQQPRGSQQNYARRNVIQFNNVNVHKPKQRQRKNQ